MSTRAIKKKRQPGEGLPGGDDWQSLRETAPSVVRADQPTFARRLAVVGLMAVCVGGLAVLAPQMGMNYLVAPGWGMFLLALGCCALLYHAFSDKDVQFRRLYGLVGFAFVLVGMATRILPGSQGMGTPFLPFGTPTFMAGLFFLITFVRNETDESLRSKAIYLIGGVGALLASIGFIGGFWNEGFLLGQGVVHLVLGLIYLWAFISVEGGSSTDLGFWMGWALAAVGLAAMLFALAASFGSWLLFRVGVIDTAPLGRFFVPSGLVLLYFGLEYFLLGLAFASDNRVVVLTKRELQAYFFSPMAYIVLIGVTVVGWLSFVLFFLNPVLDFGGEGILEPVIRYYLWGFLQLIPLLFIIPVLTMRLLSEEKRTGTLEVLLTAPVNETSVVLAKFMASVRFFLLCWYPWGLMLVALRIEGSDVFDFRPALTFFLALTVFGSGFLAMGLFFSSLTRNQVIAAILTFAAMLVWTFLALAREFVGGSMTNLGPVLEFVSYYKLAEDAARGIIVPRQLVFHGSLAVFWLFLSVKVLESRKWS